MTITTTSAQDAALGDSIALGTGRALGLQTYARVGAGSCEIASYAAASRPWDRLVVSAGINDGGACVASIRAKIKARRVVWILPAPINAGRAAVLRALRPGDRLVGYACRRGCSRVDFHPADYSTVARAVRRAWARSH